MLRRIAGCVVAIGCLVLGQFALAEGQACENDWHCDEDEYCMLLPCTQPPCDPEEASCEEWECLDDGGICMADHDLSWFAECSSDEDCGGGWVCTEYEEYICRPCSPDDEDCLPTGECETWQTSICTPSPCESNDECGEGLLCISVEIEDCETELDVDCEPEMEDCETEIDEDCEPLVEAYCLPPFFMQCESADECLDGYECVALETCSCSGSGWDDEYIEECECVPGDESFCRPIIEECEQDEECPEGWSCEVIPSGMAVPCAWDQEQEETVCDDPQITEETGYCLPPYYQAFGAGDFFVERELGSDNGDDRPGEGPGSGEDTESPQDPDAPAAPRSDSGGSSGGGCQVVAGQPSSLPLVLLALIGMAVMGLRRRQSH